MRARGGGYFLGVLRDWLDAANHDAFLQHRTSGHAFALPNATKHAGPLLDWTILGRVLAGRADSLVIQDGQLREGLVAPRSAAGLQTMMRSGVGLVVRRAQRNEASVHALACRFEREFACEVHVQLFVTPAATRGFSWHYDREDVVILQTLGQKTYYFRVNTMVSEPAAVEPDFTRLPQETSPILTCTLCAGDALYLPHGMWHMARAVEDSLSISLGLAVGTPRR